MITTSSIWKAPFVFSIVFSVVFAIIFSVVFSVVFTIVLDRTEQDDLEADHVRMHPLPLPKKQRAAEVLRLTVR